MSAYLSYVHPSKGTLKGDFVTPTCHADLHDYTVRSHGRMSSHQSIATYQLITHTQYLPSFPFISYRGKLTPILLSDLLPQVRRRGAVITALSSLHPRRDRENFNPSTSPVRRRRWRTTTRTLIFDLPLIISPVGLFHAFNARARVL